MERALSRKQSKQLRQSMGRTMEHLARLIAMRVCTLFRVSIMDRYILPTMSEFLAN